MACTCMRVLLVSIDMCSVAAVMHGAKVVLTATFSAVQSRLSVADQLAVALQMSCK